MEKPWNMTNFGVKQELYRFGYSYMTVLNFYVRAIVKSISKCIFFSM
jgi:hypothetical protein